MATFLPNLASYFITLCLLTSSLTIPATGETNPFAKTIDRRELGGLLGKQKLTHFRLYWHDILTGRNPTAVPIIQPLNNSALAFGAINMIDDPLTEGPELNSKLMGRAQGFYASAAQQELGLLMAMNFAFVQGKYNGSTITVLGRNAIFSEVREMPVIGGSGLFRFARGYVQARTHKVDFKTGDATVEYNVYVMHY